MPIIKNQSAIAEVRDQLFLDTADGNRLNVVSANLGMYRPVFGFTDDVWRALVKKIALQPKTIHKMFRDILDICTGPQFSRVGVLEEASVVNDLSLTMHTASQFVQVGTVTIDAGLATEEDVNFCFRDVDTGEMFFDTELQYSHAALSAEASTSLRVGISAGATTLPVFDTADFPTTGFPYTVLLDRGTENEEAVTITAVTPAITGGQSQLAVDVTTAAALPTYVQAGAGPGATLTATAVGVLTVDGVATVLGDRILVKNGAADSDNGIYEVTTEGTAGVAFVLTRATDHDSDTEVTYGDYVMTLNGTVNGGTTFQITTGNPITVDTTAVTWAVTGTLTCSATTLAHPGPSAGLERYALAEATQAGRTFIKLALADTRRLSETGLLRIDGNGSGEEFVFYDEVDVDTGVVDLSNLLANSHAVGVSVEPMELGALVDTAQVWQKGKYWDIFETQPRNLQVYIPKATLALRLLDATYGHDPDPGAASTTLSSAASSGDTSIAVVSVLGFPNEAAMIDVGTSPERAMYGRRDSGDPVEYSQAAEPYALADGQTLTVSVDGGGAATATFNTGDFVDITAATAAEVALVINTDVSGVRADVEDGFVRIMSDTFPESSSASIEVTGGTANPELEFKTPTLLLSRGLTGGFSGGEAVVLVEHPYAATDLEEGDHRDGSRVVRTDYYPGPYVYDINQRGPSDTDSTLATAVIPGPARVAFAQSVGATNLEVDDLSLWPSATFDVKIGRTSGFEEDRSVSDVTLAAGLSTTVTGAHAPLATTLDVGVSSGFPETSIPNVARYRIIVDAGGANEQILTVLDNDTVAGEFTLAAPGVGPALSGGETVELLNDVLTFSLGLTEVHKGPSVSPTTEGHLVEKFVSTIPLVSAAGFTVGGGTVIFNQGQERPSVRARITTVVGPSVLEFADTSAFPTSNFPYQVIVSDGRTEQEFGTVTANDTVLNRLSFTPALVNTHFVGSYVEFISGDSESVTYQSVSGNDLVLSPAQILTSKHTIGERVVLSPADSKPETDGSSYPFLLPPELGLCAKLMFELARAAGVQVTIIDER